MRHSKLYMLKKMYAHEDQFYILLND